MRATLLTLASLLLIGFTEAHPQSAPSQIHRHHRSVDAGQPEKEAKGGDSVPPGGKFTPKGCANGTMCEDDDDYPKDHLNTILKNDLEKFKSYFKDDKEKVTTRLGETFDDLSPICFSTERVIFPKVAQNEKNDWLFVVNLDQGYRQDVRVELCRVDNEPCEFSVSFAQGYESGCMQKYVYRDLLAVSSDGQLSPDSFRIPSCCACYYKKN